jgi:CIC family chloride channel protein
MLLIGSLMYALLRTSGQYYVDGVGYATIQAILSGGLIAPGLLALLFFAKLCATSVSLGSGASGGIFSPSLFMGATIGGAFGAAISAIHPVDGLGVTTCAMIGMAAMVGGGTGAAMTAVTMIFEMTRDYDLVMPIIVAVALAIGVRRLLSQENIYTVKLVGRKHFVPKALHANMFLVRRAGEVMERDVTMLPKDTRLESFLRQGDHEGRMKHIVVTDGDRIVGVFRVNTALRRGLEDIEKGFTVGEIAQRNYTVAREEDIVFDVVTRMTRHNAGMAVVTKAKGRPRAADLLGVITKEHIADSVADSIKPYA